MFFLLAVLVAKGCGASLMFYIDIHHALSITVVPHIPHIWPHTLDTTSHCNTVLALDFDTCTFFAGSGVDGLAQSSVLQIMGSGSRSMALAMPHHRVVVNINVNI